MEFMTCAEINYLIAIGQRPGVEKWEEYTIVGFYTICEII